MNGKVGIFGHRSWMAGPLIKELRARSWQPILFEKSAPSLYAADLAALIIIPGRLNQTDEEMAAEISLVCRVANHTNACNRQILLGSRASLDTRYGKHKAAVERAFIEERYDRRVCASIFETVKPAQIQSVVVRPGAVFGPGQPTDSHMLIPTLSREADPQLFDPGAMASFIYVDDLAKHLVDCVTHDPQTPWTEPNWIPGEFKMTARQMQQLYKTFRVLDSRNAPDE